MQACALLRAPEPLIRCIIGGATEDRKVSVDARQTSGSEMRTRNACWASNAKKKFGPILDYALSSMYWGHANCDTEAHEHTHGGFFRVSTHSKHGSIFFIDAGNLYGYEAIFNSVSI